MADPDIGATYLASGDKYIRMAVISAESVRRFSPELRFTLFTDAKDIPPPPPFERVLPLRREEIEVPSDQALYRSFLVARYHSLLESPYRRTLAIDPDTYCLGPIEPVFTLLEQYDVALASAHNRFKCVTSVRSVPELAGLPFGFGPVQGGVIFCNRDNTRDLWLDVIAYYKKLNHYCDQSVVRKFLWEKNVRCYMLPEEFNFNTIEFIKRARKQNYNTCIPRVLHYTDKKLKSNFEALPHKLEKYVQEIQARLRDLRDPASGI